MTTLTLQPAYGRDYKSRDAVVADWHAGKDFLIASYGPDMGRYVNKQDLNGGTYQLNFRYQRDTKLAVFTSRGAS